MPETFTPATLAAQVDRIIDTGHFDPEAGHRCVSGALAVETPSVSAEMVRDDVAHGTITAYTRDGCRCGLCRAAATRQRNLWNLRTRADHAGRATVPWMVDARPVRDHIQRLADSGWTIAAIAREAGIIRQTIVDIRVGDSRTTRRTTAARILAIEPLAPVPLDPVVVERVLAGQAPASITAAERQAVVEAGTARGLSAREIAELLGVGARTVQRRRGRAA